MSSPLSLTITDDDTSDTVIVGSLQYDSKIIAANETYILAGHVIPCNGTVVAWEFCYQISNVTSATLYPSIWKITKQDENNGDTDYELVQSNNITFDPSGTADHRYPCKVINLSATDQFIALNGSVMGLYSNTEVMQPQLLITDDMNSLMRTYKLNGNQSKFRSRSNRMNNAVRVNYNIALRVHLGKFCSIIIIAS